MTKKEEQHEQYQLVNWCKEQGLEPWATAQATWTSSWPAINQNKALGVRPGVPDLIVFIPSTRSTTGKTHLLFIEMKKKKGGVASKEQINFLSLVEQVHGDIHGKVCHGFEEAKKLIEPLLKEREPIKDLNQFINNL